MNGIDISSWQADIDISKLTTTDFVIVKATGGTRYVNPYFQKHMAEAMLSGKLVGCYHYAREKSCKGTSDDEAKHFCDNIAPYIGNAMLILDWEEELSLGTNWPLYWLEKVKQITGVQPIIYTSQSVCEQYNWSAVAEGGYKLWLAQYPNYNPTDYKSSPWRSGGTGAFDGYIMHQYSSTGRITGYNGNLDLNLFYGNEEDWKAICDGCGQMVSNAEEIENLSDDMKWAINNNLLFGYGNNRYGPKDHLTREQAASMFRRFLKEFIIGR